MNIAWGITGAGHFLRESYEVFKKLAEEHKVTILISSAGEEVLQMYGLLDKMTSISCGGYLEEIFLESEMGRSFSKTGRFLLGRYDSLVISPATSNTVAKIVHGIADSLITNAVALASKGRIPVYIMPVDVSGRIKSEMPYFMDRKVCEKCEDCIPKRHCPAIAEQIDLLKCDGCGICVKYCPNNAIRKGFVEFHVRDVDAKNVDALRSMKNVFVLDTPTEILKVF
ncbi:MAG: dihydromethanopterin reductase (acceptor) [Methanocellales archaeon]|nr:dihydromethanopterin reductase (acceptor) [Methanocellales archaeon]